MPYNKREYWFAGPIWCRKILYITTGMSEKQTRYIAGQCSISGSMELAGYLGARVCPDR